MAKRTKTPWRDCVICGEQFEVTQKNGSAKTCGPDCSFLRHKQMTTRWAKEHPERRAETARALRLTNPETYRAIHLDYRERNRDKLRERTRRWRERRAHAET